MSLIEGKRNSEPFLFESFYLFIVDWLKILVQRFYLITDGSMLL
jgi:hypothetical protein